MNIASDPKYETKKKASPLKFENQQNTALSDTFASYDELLRSVRQLTSVPTSLSDDKIPVRHISSSSMSFGISSTCNTPPSSPSKSPIASAMTSPKVLPERRPIGKSFANLHIDDIASLTRELENQGVFTKASKLFIPSDDTPACSQASSSDDQYRVTHKDMVCSKDLEEEDMEDSPDEFDVEQNVFNFSPQQRLRAGASPHSTPVHFHGSNGFSPNYGDSKMEDGSLKSASVTNLRNLSSQTWNKSNYGDSTSTNSNAHNSSKSDHLSLNGFRTHSISTTSAIKAHNANHDKDLFLSKSLNSSDSTTISTNKIVNESKITYSIMRELQPVRLNASTSARPHTPSISPTLHVVAASGVHDSDGILMADESGSDVESVYGAHRIVVDDLSTMDEFSRSNGIDACSSFNNDVISVPDENSQNTEQSQTDVCPGDLADAAYLDDIDDVALCRTVSQQQTTPTALQQIARTILQSVHAGAPQNHVNHSTNLDLSIKSDNHSVSNGKNVQHNVHSTLDLNISKIGHNRTTADFHKKQHDESESGGSKSSYAKRTFEGIECMTRESSTASDPGDRRKQYHSDALRSPLALLTAKLYDPNRWRVSTESGNQRQCSTDTNPASPTSSSQSNMLTTYSSLPSDQKYQRNIMSYDIFGGNVDRSSRKTSAGVLQITSPYDRTTAPVIPNPEDDTLSSMVNLCETSHDTQNDSDDSESLSPSMGWLNTSPSHLLRSAAFSLQTKQEVVDKKKPSDQSKKVRVPKPPSNRPITPPVPVHLKLEEHLTNHSRIPGGRVNCPSDCTCWRHSIASDEAIAVGFGIWQGSLNDVASSVQYSVEQSSKVPIATLPSEVTSSSHLSGSIKKPPEIRSDLLDDESNTQSKSLENHTHLEQFSPSKVCSDNEQKTSYSWLSPSAVSDNNTEIKSMPTSPRDATTIQSEPTAETSASLQSSSIRLSKDYGSPNKFETELMETLLERLARLGADEFSSDEEDDHLDHIEESSLLNYSESSINEAMFTVRPDKAVLHMLDTITARTKTYKKEIKPTPLEDILVINKKNLVRGYGLVARLNSQCTDIWATSLAPKLRFLQSLLEETRTDAYAVRLRLEVVKQEQLDYTMKTVESKNVVVPPGQMHNSCTEIFSKIVDSTMSTDDLVTLCEEAVKGLHTAVNDFTTVSDTDVVLRTATNQLVDLIAKQKWSQVSLEHKHFDSIWQSLTSAPLWLPPLFHVTQTISTNFDDAFIKWQKIWMRMKSAAKSLVQAQMKREIESKLNVLNNANSSLTKMHHLHQQLSYRTFRTLPSLFVQLNEMAMKWQNQLSNGLLIFDCIHFLQDLTNTYEDCHVSRKVMLSVQEIMSRTKRIVHPLYSKTSAWRRIEGLSLAARYPTRDTQLVLKTIYTKFRVLQALNIDQPVLWIAGENNKKHSARRIGAAWTEAEVCTAMSDRILLRYIKLKTTGKILRHVRLYLRRLRHTLTFLYQDAIECARANLDESMDYPLHIFPDKRTLRSHCVNACSDILSLCKARSHPVEKNKKALAAHMRQLEFSEASLQSLRNLRKHFGLRKQSIHYNRQSTH